LEIDQTATKEKRFLVTITNEAQRTDAALACGKSGYFVIIGCAAHLLSYRLINDILLLFRS
jgi:hypothetical protein